MIATHVPKLINSRLKQPALCVPDVGPVPGGLLYSGSVQMRRKYWAAPSNAAQMRSARETVAGLMGRIPECSVPPLQDGRAKQVLMPRDWRADDYVAVTPVSHAGVLHEWFHRLQEHDLPRLNWMLQPNAAARSNHGELLLEQRGALRLLPCPVDRPWRSDWLGDFVAMAFRVEGANVSSGWLAAGWPAISAVGGFVHTLERASGQSIEFAFGMRAAQTNMGVRRSVNECGGGDPKPDFVVQEMTGHFDAMVLLRGGSLSAIKHAAQQLADGRARFAGGRIYRVKVSLCYEATAPAASYLHQVQDQDDDMLEVATRLIGDGGRWQVNAEGRHWAQRHGLGSVLVSQVGYVMLNLPRPEPMARGGYVHAWGESAHAIVRQGPMAESAWWRKCNDGAFVGYDGCAPIKEWA